MTDTSSRLAALRASLKTTDGQTSIATPKGGRVGSAAEKIEIQPLPISTLTAKAFTGTEKMLYSDDPQVEAKLRSLASELTKESKLSQFTTALFKVDQAIGRDPTMITQLTVEAIKLYCQASKRLVADPSGAKHVEQIQLRLKDKQTDELIALTQGGGDGDDDFDLI